MLSNRNLSRHRQEKTHIQPVEDTTNPKCTSSYRESSPTTHKPTEPQVPKFCKPRTIRIRLVSAFETKLFSRICRPQTIRIRLVSALETKLFSRFCRSRPSELGWFQHLKPSYFQGFVDPDHQN